MRLTLIYVLINATSIYHNMMMRRAQKKTHMYTQNPTHTHTHLFHLTHIQVRRMRLLNVSK